MNITQIKVIRSTDARDFEKTVNDFLLRGWSLHGKISHKEFALPARGIPHEVLVQSVFVQILIRTTTQKTDSVQ